MEQRNLSTGVFCTTEAYHQVKYLTTEEERDKERKIKRERKT